jgi:hypothetical protein
MRVINAFEPVAQSVEHVTFNHGVQGSNPCGLTNLAGSSVFGVPSGVPLEGRLCGPFYGVLCATCRTNAQARPAGGKAEM